MRITKDFLLHLGFKEVGNHSMSLEYDGVGDPEIDGSPELIIEGYDKDVCLMFSTEDHEGRWLMTFHNGTSRLINAIIIVMKGIGEEKFGSKNPTYYKSLENENPS